MTQRKKSSTVYIIDGSAYIYRAYHAITSLTTRAGMPTNAVYGFITMLLKVIRDKQPEFLAIAYDAKGPNFRHAMYSDYKANRPPMPEDLVTQIPYIHRVVAAYNIHHLVETGVEADDLIATAAHRLTESGVDVVVVSGDKDLLQLVSDRVTVWDPMSDKYYDRAAVLARYGIGVEKLLDYFALVGDSSDNVPGVPGVGPKSAQKLLTDCASLEDVYASVDQMKPGKLKERLIDNRDNAFLSRRLIALRGDLDVSGNPDDYRLPAPDVAALRELYRELEFAKLAREELPAETMSTNAFNLMTDAAEVPGLLKELGTAEYLVIDLETSSLDPLVAELVGIALAGPAGEVWYLPVGHRQADGSLVAGQLDRDQLLAVLAPLLEDPFLPKLGHNLKYDYAVLVEHGITLAGPLWDTMIASYLLDPSRRSHKLDLLAEEFLDRRLTSFEAVTDNDKRSDAFVWVALDRASDYACEDVAACRRLWQQFRPEVEALDMWPLFADMEMELMPILAAMERRGVLVDPVELDRLSADFAARLTTMEEKIYRLAGESFNINSPRQLGEILFDKLKMPHGRKTKTGYSTDVKVLEQLARYHGLPAEIIGHRTITKLKTTYVDRLTEQIHPKTGRVHTSFNQTVTATGRLSSSNPNLQNIPIRTEEGMAIRRAFVAAPGHFFVAADYSQIDLRVLAHYCRDEALLQAFRSGGDIHSQTAAEIFMVNPQFITREMRRVAKTINFGIIYGMSAFGLASELNVSRKEAGIFIDRYFAHYQGVQRFMEEIVVEARAQGFVTTLANRRRLLPEINSSNRVRREFAERTAINTPIQGTAADIIKLATLAVERYLHAAGLDATLVLQIHDELVLEVPVAEVERVESGVRQAMENVMKLAVPLAVNIKTGLNLADL